MKRKKAGIILILFILLVKSYCEEFVKEGLFSFSYPGDRVKVYDLSLGLQKRSKDKLTLYLYINDINQEIRDEITFLNMQGIKSERQNLINGKLNKIEYSKLIRPEVLKIDKIYGKRFLVLDKPVIDSLFFQLHLIFYIKNYRVIFTLDDFVHRDELIQENLECYEKIEQIDSFGDMVIYYLLNYRNKNYKNSFYASLFDPEKKASYEWNKTFESIIQSIKILDYSIYTPTIDNLRFRSSAGIKGKFIRMLKKGEILELLEAGHEETIDDDPGRWIKVITESGDSGWCFDAYLEKLE